MFVSDTVGCKHATPVFQSNAVEDNGFLLHNQADLHKPNLFFESFNSHTNNIWHVLTNLFCRLGAINASKKACPPDSPQWHEMTASFASNYWNKLHRRTQEFLSFQSPVCKNIHQRWDEGGWGGWKEIDVLCCCPNSSSIALMRPPARAALF